MCSKFNIDFSLSYEEINSIFPFFIAINKHLEIVDAGTSLRKSFPANMHGENFLSCFEVISHKQIIWESLPGQINQLWAFKSKLNALKYRGQLLIKDELAYFLVSAWVNDADELEAFGLNIDDFAIHDAINDIFLLKQSAAMSLNDARKINNELLADRQSLRVINEELCLKEAYLSKLAKIISSIDVSVCAFDLNGEILWANKAFNEIIKSGSTSYCSFYEMPVFKLVDEEIKITLLEHIRQNKTFETEIFISNHNGRFLGRWYVARYQPISGFNKESDFYLAAFWDISEKKQLSADLDNIFALCPDGLIAFGGDRLMSYANPAFYNLLGFSKEDTENLTIEQISALIEQNFKIEKKINDGSCMLLKEKPDLTVLSHIKKETFDQYGKLLSSIFYFQDVTKLYEMEKLKSDFLSMAAHELRTPMSSIHGFTELLLRRKFNKQDQDGMLETIHKQTTRLVDILNDLLDLAKIESNGANEFIKERHDLADVLKDLMAEFDSGRMKVDIPNKKVYVYFDKYKIIRAITNVISNAIKYSDKGTPIYCSMTTIDNVWVLIRVEDKGIGMTSEQLNKLFTKFYRVDKSGKIPGTGLGMCLVKEIIELHDGKVEVQSIFGQGTIVDIKLPVAASSSLLLQ